jgi:hypothetical protein
MATARRMKAPLAGLQAPAVTVLAFVPMLLTSIGYSELNKAGPDCGTTFTWATRAPGQRGRSGPRSGWAAGWAIIVAGVLWIVAMTYVAYRGIELKPAINPILELEDLTRWPRPYSATSAGQIPACSQRCVAFSNKYATWNPS